MKTAIIYSSRYGFTEKVAVKLKEKIQDQVTLISVDDATTVDIDNVDHIIFGCPVYAGKLRSNMIDFMNQNKVKLADKKVGMYVCSLNEFKTASYLEQSLSKGLINQLSAYVYSGYSIDFDKVKLVERLAVKTMMSKDDELYMLNEEALDKLIDKMKINLEN